MDFNVEKEEDSNFQPGVQGRKKNSWIKYENFMDFFNLFYIAISNTTLFKNDLLSDNVSLKENLEKLAFDLSPDPKTPKEIQVRSSKSHILLHNNERGMCSSLNCSSNDKRTPLFCSNCEKYFHQACFSRTHSS